MINDCWKDFQNDFNKIFKIVNRVNKVSVDINDYIDDLNKTYKNLLNYKTNDKNLLYLIKYISFSKYRFCNHNMMIVKDNLFIY